MLCYIRVQCVKEKCIISTQCNPKMTKHKKYFKNSETLTKIYLFRDPRLGLLLPLPLR